MIIDGETSFSLSVCPFDIELLDIVFPLHHDLSLVYMSHAETV
jgi:hypothetical protein